MRIASGFVCNATSTWDSGLFCLSMVGQVANLRPIANRPSSANEPITRRLHRVCRLLLSLSLSLPLALAQMGAPGAQTGIPSQPVRPAIQAPTPGVQNPFTGSAPPEQPPPSAKVFLSLDDAIQRGLRYNLGLVLSGQNTRVAQAGALRARSALLPSLSARIAQNEEQVNLAAFGFNIKVPGFAIPNVVGPFSVFDARAYLTQNLFDLRAIRNARAGNENARAAALNERDARDVVVQIVASGYIQVLADQAQVNEATAEVNTAQALYQRAVDQQKAGVTPAIDTLRAQVELQAQQTRLRQLQNDQAKDHLALARLIGIPMGQNFELTGKFEYTPLTSITETAALDRALKNRSDYLASLAQLHAAELAHGAAVAERYPSLALSADYGTIGPSPITNHGTFTVSAGARMSLFDGGRIRADIEQADAALAESRATVADTRERVRQQIAVAFLDLQTAADQVRVAGSSADLARQALTQAQDRFTAGVADNIEVVQAQTALTNATETYIASIYAHNLAKVALARAIGTADLSIKELLTTK